MSQTFYQNLLIALSAEAFDSVAYTNELNALASRAVRLVAENPQANLLFVHWVDFETYPVLEDNLIGTGIGVVRESNATQLDLRRQALTQVLDAWFQDNGHTHMSYEVKIILGEVGFGLSTMIKNEQIDLVVVGRDLSHYQGFLNRFLPYHTSNEFIEKSQCDLLSVFVQN